MKVIRQIARGGFGRVEEVQIRDGVRVARKVLDPLTSFLPEEMEKLRRRFEREVKTQSSLSPNIVLPILDFDLGVKHPWYTMPLAGKNYLQQIDEDRAANRISIEPLADILNALEELHNLGLVHRDLKPENILLHDGKWKLSDFGLVTPQASTASRLTSTNSWWGTKPYMAPEQEIAFREVTPAADIYSFGCILHDLVDGSERIPFSKQTCDGPLAPIIEKCTEPYPHRRFENVSKLRSVLLTALTLPNVQLDTTRDGDWPNALDDVSTWSTERFEEFVRFLKHINIHSENSNVIYRHIDEETIEVLHDLDPSLWATLVELYCHWTDQNFDFNYCDVLAPRLHKIFDLGDINQKVAAALAAAQLGNSHNRWFVMRHVLAMCGPTLDEPIAHRIAIEIEIGDRHLDFIRCARTMSLEPSSYHPIIARVLRRPREREES